MPLAAWVTLAITALIIAITAVGLLRVIIHLAVVRRTLAGVVAGTETVADRTGTVPSALTSVNTNLKPVRDFCESV